MEFHSVGRVGLVEIFDRCDAVPRVLLLRTPEGDAEFTPAEAARLSQRLLRVQATGVPGVAVAAGPTDARELLVLRVMPEAKSAHALGEFVGAWVRFETDQPPRAGAHFGTPQGDLCHCGHIRAQHRNYPASANIATGCCDVVVSEGVACDCARFTEKAKVSS